MMQQLDAYQKLLQQLVDLEQQLMHAFEAQVPIIPPPREFLELYRPKLDHIDWANNTISKILSVWPQDVMFSSVLVLKQREGVIVLNRQNWLFTAHGSDEVSFIPVSPTLDSHILEHLKQGKTNVLRGSRSYYGDGGCVEAKYLHEG